MATTKTIKTRLQLIGGNGLEWAGKTLLKNEIGVEWGYTITGQDEGGNDIVQSTNELIGIKIGDGTSTWEELDYFGGEDAHVFADITVSAGADHNTAIAEAVGDIELVVGDIAIVKELITGDKYSYTAYVFDGYDVANDNAPIWKAMDGNVDAKNVYYSSDIQVTKSVGNVTTSNNTPVDLKFAGKNLEQIWQYLYATEDLTLSITQPSASLTATGTKSAEVGNAFDDPKVTLTFADGNYEYGSKDSVGTTYTKANGAGVQWGNAAIYLKGSTEALASKTTSGNTKLEVTYDISSNIIAEGTVTYEFTATASCPASTRKPVTNLGNFINSSGKATTVYNDGTQQTSAITNKTYSTSVSVTGWRSCFWGYKAGGATLDVNALTSDQIRALGNTPQSTLKSYTKNDPYSTTKMQQMFFAAPKGKYTSVTVANAVNGAPQTVTKITDVMVKGFNGYAAVAYDVWYVSNDNADSGAATYTVTIA